MSEKYDKCPFGLNLYRSACYMGLIDELKKYGEATLGNVCFGKCLRIPEKIRINGKEYRVKAIHRGFSYKLVLVPVE